MQSIFNDSRIGTLTINDPGALARTNLGCASLLEVTATRWVPQDMAAYLDLAQPGYNVVTPVTGVLRATTNHRAALAHVRRSAQLGTLRTMLRWVQFTGLNGRPRVNINVYLIGGFRQAQPADDIVRLITGNLIGYGAWPGVTTTYAHIKKGQAENMNVQGNNGHIPAFVAQITAHQQAMYAVGTSDIAGCVAVLAVPAAAAVVIKKVHLFDRNYSVVQGPAGLNAVALDPVGFP